jgi:hypothetical protein
MNVSQGLSTCSKSYATPKHHNLVKAFIATFQLISTEALNLIDCVILILYSHALKR